MSSFFVHVVGILRCIQMRTLKTASSRICRLFSCNLKIMSSHICRLSQVPDDILLHTLSFLGLLDNISFSMVCKKTHALSMHRSFWIYALENESLMRPIACPSHEDLTSHDLQSLRRIALHTLRLERNWASKTPQIMGPIRTLLLDLSISGGFYQIPGTQLYLFHTLYEHTLELWDIGRGARIGTPIQVADTLVNLAGRETLPGQFLMAFLGSKSIGAQIEYQIVVARVEYRRHNGSEDVALKLLLKHKLTKGKKHLRVFLDNDLVGTLCSCHSDQGEDPTCVTALNLVTMKEVLIMTDLPTLLVSNMVAVITPVIDGDLHILASYHSAFSAFVVPRSQLPHTDNPQCSQTSTETLQVERFVFPLFSQHARALAPLRNSYSCIMKANSCYGIPTVSISTASTNSKPDKFLDVHFWVRSGDPKAPITLLSPPMVIPGAFDGPEDSYQPAAMALSGKTAVFMYTVLKGETPTSRALGLISYDPDHPEKVSYRNLALPASFDMSDIYTMEVDDHMGVITLFDSFGSLYTISYA